MEETLKKAEEIGTFNFLLTVEETSDKTVEETLKKAMQQNGSPEPEFDFDEERSWFQVLLPIHPNFEQNIPVTIELNEVIWDINGIDKLLNEVLEKVEFKQKGGIAGGIASGIVRDIAIAIEYPDNHAIAVIDAIDRDIAGGIASGIAGGIDNKL